MKVKNGYVCLKEIAKNQELIFKRNVLYLLIYFLHTEYAILLDTFVEIILTGRFTCHSYMKHVSINLVGIIKINGDVLNNFKEDMTIFVHRFIQLHI